MIGAIFTGARLLPLAIVAAGGVVAGGFGSHLLHVYIIRPPIVEAAEKVARAEVAAAVSEETAREIAGATRDARDIEREVQNVEDLDLRNLIGGSNGVQLDPEQRSARRRQQCERVLRYCRAPDPSETLPPG